MPNLRISDRKYDLIANVMTEAVYPKSVVINDLENKMVYDKQYRTSSSIIYSASLLVDRVNYISSKNNMDKVQIAIELGWKRGVYINLSVNVASTPAVGIYKFIMFVILLTLSMFKDGRMMSEEEQRSCKEVMDGADNYDIKAN